MHQWSGNGVTLVEGQKWFLAHTLPRSEVKAEFHLSAQGFKTFLPKLEKTVRHARKMTIVPAPLFPSYIFVGLDLARDRWLSIRSTVGVSSLVTCDSRPAAVPAGIVESLIAQTDQRGLTRLDLGLVAGSRVRILAGPFADLVGQLAKLDANGRVRVLLKLMGGEIPVALHRSLLAPAA